MGSDASAVGFGHSSDRFGGNPSHFDEFSVE
jgi:hypothetical protein